MHMCHNITTICQHFVLSISYINFGCFQTKSHFVTIWYSRQNETVQNINIVSSLPNLGLDASQAKARVKEKANMQKCRSDVDFMQPLQRLM